MKHPVFNDTKNTYFPEKYIHFDSAHVLNNVESTDNMTFVTFQMRK